jgi:hypothetical protein
MTQHECWPPPDWTEVVVTWQTMLGSSNHVPNDIIAWCHQYDSKGLWHLHGWQATEGFAFRFEDARDATAFGLRWG